MVYDPKKHNRRSIRLKGYDYSSPGEYFITICTQHRECLFGTVADEKMQLNSAGWIVDKWWQKVFEKFPNAVLDVYQIMPNHFHAIVGITKPQNVGVGPCVNPDRDDVGVDPRVNPESHNVGADPRVSPAPRANPEKNGNPNQGGHVGPPLRDLFQPVPASIDGIMQWFKTMTTNEYIRGVKNGLFPPFDRKIWHRNYYEHIIRNEKSLERIRNYIINNPVKWEMDRNHPNNF